MAIRWRLNILMAERRMTNKDLGDRIGRHEVSVSRLRVRDDMPRLDGNELEALCNALNCKICDLIERVEDHSDRTLTPGGVL